MTRAASSCRATLPCSHFTARSSTRSTPSSTRRCRCSGRQVAAESADRRPMDSGASPDLYSAQDIRTKGDSSMTAHEVTSREEWLAAREKLLEREKEHTRLGDELARRRRELPWVRVEKEYRF